MNMRKYIHYHTKQGVYSAEFRAEDDHAAKIITKRIHGPIPEGLALYRILTPLNGRRRIKGIQL